MQQRLFEDLIESDVVAHKTKQGYTLPVSIAIHMIVLLAVVVVPLLTSEELPEPTSVVKAFFVEPAAPPPPPPPPPPPAPRAQTQPKPMSTPVPTENNFQPPIEPPEDVNPSYPGIARQPRVQAVLILECTISPQGKSADVKVLRGIPLLDAAAIEAVKQWVYSPTLLNGVPVPVIMTVTVNFKLS